MGTIAFSKDWEGLQKQGWRWLENHVSLIPNIYHHHADIEVQRRQQQRLAQLKEEYGEENVETGNAFNAITSHPSGIPKQYGVYVREVGSN